MVATNDVGDSVPSRETEAATTLQDGEKLGCWHCMGEKKWEDGALRGFENIIWCKGMGSVSDFSFSSPHSLCVFFPVPNEPPVILSVKPTTTTSVLVHWKVRLLTHQQSLINTEPHNKTYGSGARYLLILRIKPLTASVLICTACVLFLGCNYCYILKQERSERRKERLEKWQEGKAGTKMDTQSWDGGNVYLLMSIYQQERCYRAEESLSYQ